MGIEGLQQEQVINPEISFESVADTFITNIKALDELLASENAVLPSEGQAALDGLRERLLNTHATTF